jgi:redox-sensing transcriptional repressor
MAQDLAPISPATLRRLPDYYHYVQRLRGEGHETVSAAEVARDLHLDPTQVRKDLAATGIVGRPRVGFEVAEVIEAVEQLLGFNDASDAILVGAGNLGQALLRYDGFKSYGVNILAAFDSDSRKVGLRIGGREVFPIDKLQNLVRRLHVRLGILTVPADAAQDLAERMVSAGIEGIWNFAPVTLTVPENVIVENTRLYETFAALSQALVKKARSARLG